MNQTTTRTTTEASPLTQAIKRLAIPKDAKRVMIALADANTWTPMTALETVLGKTGLRRVVESVKFLLGEGLIKAGTREGDPMLLHALAVEEWTNDNHFTVGARIQWGD